MSSKKNSTPKAKEPIKIRFKKIANGNKSIYLDLYIDGKREYDYLKLYLIPETSPTDKAANVKTLELANAIKAQKIVELQNTAHGFKTVGTRSKMGLIDYINSLAEKKRAKAGGGKRTTAESYLALAKHITAYNGSTATFKQIDRFYCMGFIDYLKTAKNANNGQILNENTQAGYMKSFEHVLNCAIIDELIVVNPFKQIKPENKPKKHKAEICYLTFDEIKKLENADFPVCTDVKKAFLFSCYTGLRFSDVKNITWGQLQKDNNNDILITYVQKKTKKQEYLPIPQIAIKYLPEITETKSKEKIFKIPDGSYCNKMLKFWSAAAGISKHLTFHVARHTYATLLLSLETPIETVSKNLGHSEIRTTQIYAKVVSKSQREAVNKLDSLNND